MEPRRVTFQTISSTATTAASTASFAAAAPSSSSSAAIRFGCNIFGEMEMPAAGSGGGGGAGAADGAAGAASPDTKLGAEKTFRLKLKLFQTDSSSYPEFNYSKLLHVEKKKLKKLKQKPNGFADPFGAANEDDDDVARIAKELERKYSGAYGGSGGRSRGRKDADLGFGYDVSDSFIDNTEAYDEVLPEEMETKEGGFYINSGALVFKSLYNEPAKTKTDEIIKMPNRPKKRVLSTSTEASSSGDDNDGNDDDDDDDDDDEGDNTNGDDDGVDDVIDVPEDSEVEAGAGLAKSKTARKEKRRKADGAEAAKKSRTNNAKRHDKKAGGGGLQSLAGSLSNSPKPALEEAACSDSDKDRARQKTVKTTTVKDMLKAKRDNFLKMQEDAAGDTKTVNGELRGAATKSSDDESTDDDSDDGDSDSNHSDQKRSSSSSKDAKRTGGSNDDGSEKLRTSETKLPELESETTISIQAFKDLAKTKNLIGKRFQFDEHLSEVFLKIDESLLCIERSQRNMVFAHLEFELLLPKYYFLRKAKQLRIKEEKMKSKRALGKLRKAVIEAMPGAIAAYEVELRKTAESQSGNLIAEQLAKMPKKKFPWDSNLRNLLYDVYQVRWTSYPVLRTRKESLEDFINIFMRDKVVEIWPSGWMRYDELQKEIERRKTAAKKVKEKKKHASSAQLVGSNAAMAAAAGIGDSTTAANDRHIVRQDEAVSSGRSCANSDTDSVASSSNSSALKRKTTDAKPKSSKSKAQKLNNAESAPSCAADEELVTSSKRIDPNNIYNNVTIIDSGILSLSCGTATTHSNATTSTAPITISGTTTATTASSAIDSNALRFSSATDSDGISLPPGNQPMAPDAADNGTHSIMARPYAHIIDLDKYKSASDILQTSKKMLHHTAAPAPAPVTATAPSEPNTRRSSSDSDGVEIVGVFRAEPKAAAPATTVAVAAAPPAVGKQKHKRNGNRSVTPVANASNSAMDASVIAFATASTSSTTSAAGFMKTCPTTNNNNNSSNTNNNNKRTALGLNNSSAGGGSSGNGSNSSGGSGFLKNATLANFDVAKVINVLKELEMPQSVSSKTPNQ